MVQYAAYVFIFCMVVFFIYLIVAEEENEPGDPNA